MSQTAKGKGFTKSIDAASHNETRRTKKRAQQAAAQARTAHRRATAVTDVTDEAPSPAAQRQTAADKRAKSAKAKLDLHRDQRRKALFYPELDALKSGTLAHTVAHAILDAFPDAQVSADRAKSKTTVAVDQAMTALKLTAKDQAKSAAVRRGISTARSALTWAFEQLKSHDESIDPIRNEDPMEIIGYAEFVFGSVPVYRYEVDGTLDDTQRDRADEVDFADAHM